MRNVYLLFLFILSTPSLKAQQQSRLIAKTELDYDGTNFNPSDSFTYIYYDGRGSDMKTGEYKFDTAVHYQWPAGNPELYERTLQEFYGDKKLKEKTTQRYQNNEWTNQFRETYYYNSNGNVDSLVKDQWHPFNLEWIRLTRLKYTYNTGKQLLLLENQSWSFTDYATTARTIYTYNGNNLTKVTGEEFDLAAGTWYGTEQHIYTYFSSNLLYSDSLQLWDINIPGWAHQYRTSYKYDAASNVDTLLEQDWDPATTMYTAQYLHAYNYNANKSITTDSFYIWDQTNLLWQHARNFYNTYDANNNLLQAIEETDASGSFVNYRKREWTYNSFNQPLVYLAYSWDIAASAWVYLNGTDNQLRYYYQAFDPTAIEEAFVQSDFIIYPNPASQFISIKLPNTSANSTVSIWNLEGKLLMQSQAQGSTLKNIPIGNLPAGNYVLKVVENNKEMTKRLWIAH